jgi:hypothetical protein
MRLCFPACFGIFHSEGPRKLGERVKLNVAQFQVYADDANLDKNIYAMKESTQAHLASSKKTGLQTITERTMYMLLPHQ